MNSKCLKILTLLAIYSLFKMPRAMAEATSTVPACGLHSETTPFQIAPPVVPVSLQWGVNVPDYVHLLTDFKKGSEKRLKTLLKLLKKDCANLTPPSTAQNKACEFIGRYEEHQRTQTQLQALLDDQTFLYIKSLDETQFRSLNFALNQLSDAVSNQPEKNISPAIALVVNWMYQRRDLARRIDDITAYFKVLHYTPNDTAHRVLLPALKAHFSSPLLIGQIAYFLRDQQCAPNELPACREANRQLRVWLIEQLQPLRANLENLMCVFEQRVPAANAYSVSKEIYSLKELYAEDSAFIQPAPEASSRYASWLENQMISVGEPGGLRAQASLGVVILSEILDIFSKAIPEQEALSSSVIHKDIAPLEIQIQNEIQSPIHDLETLTQGFQKGLK